MSHLRKLGICQKKFLPYFLTENFIVLGFKFWSLIHFELFCGYFERFGLKMIVLYKFSSISQSCLTLCNPMDCSMPGLPVHQQLPELAQTHVQQVSEAIQPTHALSSPSPPALNLSQNQGFFL